ncbi:hypothetical protein Patl1_36706 [Pistacia atlantica]|nr:hypothetical protein Patl1_36706 [Pistacia atlantica]
MSYKGKTILFDCGIHPAYLGMAALPYFDEIDPSTIDVLLITHFHLGHAASLPYFLEKSVYAHATKAIYKLLLTDYVKVSKVSVEDMLFDEQDINRSMDKIEVLDFHQTVEVFESSILEIILVKKIAISVLLSSHNSPDICIIESTYGVQLHQPRHIREKRFNDVIHTTISHGGRVLIPAFALGHAQELLLILDEYWSNHPELHNIPIYYASPLAKKCMAVYQTYILSMNERIRNQFANSNPFKFKHISPLNSIEDFNDVGPSVVMASPSSGTLAKSIISEPKEVTVMNGLTAPLNMQVHYISFSAHADYAQTSTYPSLPMQTMLRQAGRETPEVGETVSGILVKKGFTYQIMAPDDLHIFSQLSTANITQRITIPYSDAFGVVKFQLEQIYESVKSSTDEESGILGKKAEKVIHALLVSLFGDVKLGENGKLMISVDGNVAHLDKQSGDVESENEGLKERVRTAFQRIQSSVKPIPLSAS